jgi:hypothetical protein
MFATWSGQSSRAVGAAPHSQWMQEKTNGQAKWQDERHAASPLDANDLIFLSTRYLAIKDTPMGNDAAFVGLGDGTLDVAGTVVSE